MFIEFQQLKKIAPEDGMWNDMRWMYFDKRVLEKYRNDKLCEIEVYCGIGALILHNYSEEEEKISIEFLPKGKLIMMRAREFVSIPINERNHWLKFQVRHKDYPDMWTV